LRRLSLKKSPYYGHVEGDNFRKWAESMERGSIVTAAVYFHLRLNQLEDSGYIHG
jgi:hypothetical protein